MKNLIIPIIGIVAVTTLVVFWYFEKRVEQNPPEDTPNVEVSEERRDKCNQLLAAATFIDGAAADAFLQDCLEGKIDLSNSPFGEDENTASNPEESTYSTGGCAVGGCSGQLCGEASEIGNMVTTCEFREEYACFAHARCERQTTGKCGWTETSEYGSCMANIAS